MIFKILEKFYLASQSFDFYIILFISYIIENFLIYKISKYPNAKKKSIRLEMKMRHNLENRRRCWWWKNYATIENDSVWACGKVAFYVFRRGGKINYPIVPTKSRYERTAAKKMSEGRRSKSTLQFRNANSQILRGGGIQSLDMRMSK